MLVPKYDEDMLAVDDRPIVERVAEGEQARESLQVIADDFGSMGSCMGEGISPSLSRARFRSTDARTRVRTPETTGQAQI